MESIGKRLYSFVFVIGVFLVLFSGSRFVTPNILINIKNILPIAVAGILFFISIFYDSWNVSEIMFTIIIGVIVVFVYFNTGVSQPIILFLVVISSRRIPTKVVLRNVFFMQSALLFINLFLNNIGFLYNYKSFSAAKHAYGFWMPNQLGATLLQLILIILIWSFDNKFSKNKKIEILGYIYFVFILVLLYLSGSRGGEVGAIIGILLYLIQKIAQKIKFKISKKFYLIIGITPLVATILTLNDSVYQVGSLLYRLNILLTTRIQLGVQFYTDYGITLFGQKIMYTLVASMGTNYAFLDNEYLVYLINFGLVSLLIYVIYFMLLINRAYADSRFGLLIALIAFAFYGFVEQGAGEAWVNFSLLFISIFLIKPANVKISR